MRSLQSRWMERRDSLPLRADQMEYWPLGIHALEFRAPSCAPASLPSIRPLSLIYFLSLSSFESVSSPAHTCKLHRSNPITPPPASRSEKRSASFYWALSFSFFVSSPQENKSLGGMMAHGFPLPKISPKAPLVLSFSFSFSLPFSPPQFQSCSMSEYPGAFSKTRRPLFLSLFLALAPQRGALYLVPSWKCPSTRPHTHTPPPFLYPSYENSIHQTSLPSFFPSSLQQHQV